MVHNCLATSVRICLIKFKTLNLIFHKNTTFRVVNTGKHSLPWLLFVSICSQLRLYICYLGEFTKNKTHSFQCFSANDVIIKRVYGTPKNSQATRTLDLKLGHLHDDVIWLQLPECISLESLLWRFVFLQKRKNTEYNSVPQSNLVDVVKWRYHENALSPVYNHILHISATLPLSVLWILWLCQESGISNIWYNNSMYGLNSYV